MLIQKFYRLTSEIGTYKFGTVYFWENVLLKTYINRTVFFYEPYISFEKRYFWKVFHRKSEHFCICIFIFVGIT